MLQTLFNILLIILGFGVLIFVHELGHFIAAKWAGIRTEAFAIGMGPVVVSWRKGIGFRFGSTVADYEKAVREHLEEERGKQLQLKEKVDGLATSEGELPRADFYRIGDKLGLGETEYSLRWLPIGGFVKMLGQEDANPNATSDDPRSYNMRPIGKRMVVGSAGVILNLILAVILFIIAFMIGVRFEAPVVGDVSPSMPAGKVVALNAEALGVTTVGLQPGDRVLKIDGEEAKTFADLQIASAMSRPGHTLELSVERAGVDQPLEFAITPEKDANSGLLGIGIAPGASTTRAGEHDDPSGALREILTRLGLTEAGVEPGMTLISVNGREITAFGQLAQAAKDSGGAPLQTQWTRISEDGTRGPIVNAVIRTRPDFEEYRQRTSPGDTGLLGFSMLTRFVRLTEGSPNADIIKPGDVLIKLADVWYPRQSQVFETLKKHSRKRVDVVVLHDGRHTTLNCPVNRDGKLEVAIEPADDVMITAQPVMKYARYKRDHPGEIEEVETAAARSGLITLGGTTILEVNGEPVRTWSEMRAALVEATKHETDATRQAGDGASSSLAEMTAVQLLIQHPTRESPRELMTLHLNSDEVKSLRELSWRVELPSYLFEPIYTVRQGSPVQAVTMGFEETRKLILMTYLTIDRLVRGSVGVDQLRGPVGIVHIGAKVADRGFTYLIFFLAMISVNLAVINFLPLPIVDGGLFLFLVYEKFKGRPPSIAFQNVATVVGLMIIGTLFIVTFYNDVARLFS